MKRPIQWPYETGLARCRSSARRQADPMERAHHGRSAGHDQQLGRRARTECRIPTRQVVLDALVQPVTVLIASR